MFQITVTFFKFNSRPQHALVQTSKVAIAPESTDSLILLTGMKFRLRPVQVVLFGVRIQLRMDGPETSAPFTASRIDPTLHL